MSKLTLKDLLDKEYLFKQELHMLLCKANYFRIPHEVVSRLLKDHDTWEGVRVSVDVDKYDALEIWTQDRTTASVSMVLMTYLSTSKTLWMF